MKLKLKEVPSEWRKSTLLTLLALAVVSSLLRWRRIMPNTAWIILLGLFAVTAFAACLRPGWFRGYYRVSMRLGFALSQVVARVVLLLVFVLLISPLALLFRLLGKDALRLKRQPESTSYWVPARKNNSLERMF